MAKKIEEKVEEVKVETKEEEVPSKFPVKFETVSGPTGKPFQFPIHYVVEFQGKFALVNEVGQRISPFYSPNEPLEQGEKVTGVQYINKACARFNTIRRVNLKLG